MEIYNTTIKQLPLDLKKKITVMPSVDTLQRKIAAEFADLLEEKTRQNKTLTIITPVGPLDYRYFAEEVSKRGLSCRNLRTINMDEYLDGSDGFIPFTHPLSFRRFMEETFFSHLDSGARPSPENIIFPDPDHPEKVTELIEEIGGADICWGGFGITGHIAFNDPPGMLGEPDDLESFRNCKARKLTISPMSIAQMAMGGTNGNLDIIPKRAVTLGMYEILKSKKIHLTFMRSWHAGLWRKAFLGPVTAAFPGSLIQEHPDFTISMTEQVSEPPMLNTAQATGEKR